MKKHFEIYKLNRQINKLNWQMIQESGSDTIVVAGGLYHMPANQHRSTEKGTILRESINRLIDQREMVRNS